MLQSTVPCSALKHYREHFLQLMGKENTNMHKCNINENDEEIPQIYTIGGIWWHFLPFLE